jgi:hypothetical protein
MFKIITINIVHAFIILMVLFYPFKNYIHIFPPLFGSLAFKECDQNVHVLRPVYGSKTRTSIGGVSGF